MGQDKALLTFRGRPMVQIAVERLREFCTQVSIIGHRDDLSAFAPVVRDERADAGPVAGLEAGLRACGQSWAIFTPVDVPLVSADFLRRWAEATLARAEMGCGVSSLLTSGEEQPAFSLMRRGYFPVLEQVVSGGERRLRNALSALEQDGREGWLWLAEAQEVAGDLLDTEYPNLQLQNWFTNLNTPDELLITEAGLGPESVNSPRRLRDRARASDECKQARSAE